MACLRGPLAWRFLALLLLGVAPIRGEAVAQARQSPYPTRAEREFGLMEPVWLAPPRGSAFVGYEGSLSTSYFSAGLKFAPAGDLYHSGPVVMIAGGAGILPVGGFRLTASAEFSQEARFLAGYSLIDASTSLTFLLGPSVAFQQQVWLDGTFSRGKLGFGPSVLAELWSKPDSATLVTASFSYTGGDGFSWMRLHVGRRLYGYTYLGPEIALSTDGDYSQLRLGVRLTGLSFWTVSFDASVGAARASDGRSGAYLTLSASNSF